MDRYMHPVMVDAEAENVLLISTARAHSPVDQNPTSLHQNPAATMRAYPNDGRKSSRKQMSSDYVAHPAAI